MLILKEQVRRASLVTLVTMRVLNTGIALLRLHTRWKRLYSAIRQLLSGVVVTLLDPACGLDSQQVLVFTAIYTLALKGRGDLIGITAPVLLAATNPAFKASRLKVRFSTYNVMTLFDFTPVNFDPIFSAAEFWDVLSGRCLYLLHRIWHGGRTVIRPVRRTDHAENPFSWSTGLAGLMLFSIWHRSSR